MSSNTGVTNHKFAIVLNRKVPVGRALNALGHMIAVLTARADDATREAMKFVDYRDGSGGIHPVSALSLVVLQAKNGNQIRKAREEAFAAKLHMADFMESMTGGTFVEQMERTAKLGADELDYWGLAVFGPKSGVDQVCGKFSLWRDAEPVAPAVTATAVTE
jgi:hypothetical protein